MGTNKGHKVRFYKKENSLWYAFVPEYYAVGGHESNCLMVAGADKLLDELAGDRKEIELKITAKTMFCPGEITCLWRTRKGEMAVLQLKASGLRGGWGFYDVVINSWGSEVTEVELCPVSAFVFGEHPPYIIIEKEIVEAARIERGEA